MSWLISNIDPDKIFGRIPLPISQNVLISIVQQLSCSLKSQDTLKKLDWLQYCLVELDPHDSFISSYIIPVLTELQQNLETLDHELPQKDLTTVRHLTHTIKKKNQGCCV